VGSEKGLNKFDPETETFVSYQHDENEPGSLSFNTVTSIYEDKKGNLWVGTFGGGLNRFDPGKERFIHYYHDPRKPESLLHNTVTSIYEDATGTLWVSSYGGVDKYDPGEKQFEHYYKNADNPGSLNNNNVRSIYQGTAGSLWIGTEGGGLNRLDQTRRAFVHYTHDAADPVSISSNDILALGEDRRGDLWIGTNGKGLNKLDPSRGKFERYRHDPADANSLGSDTVYDLVVDQERDIVWIASYMTGLDKFDIVKNEFLHYSHDETNPNSLNSNWVTALFLDSRGRVWIGAEPGLSQFDPETETFVNYKYDRNDPRSISSDLVYTVYEDSRGLIWIGTNNGLNRYDAPTQTFIRYYRRDGLTGNRVVAIEEDDSNHLWIGTDKGLSRFDLQKKTFRNYDQRDGLQGNRFLVNASHKNAAGELFFGGTRGFNIFHPDRITDNPHVPQVVFTDFQLFNQSVGIGNASPLQQHINMTEQITLSHEQSVFSIEFAALNYRNSGKNQYAYKLDGFDREFTHTDSADRSAIYTNMDPGRYVFRVKASNNDGVWNKAGRLIEIIILPPWWETLWFRILFFSGVLGLILAVFQWRLSTVNAHRRELELEITERKKTEEALRESKNQFKGLASNIPGIVYRCACDDAWTMLYVSDYIEEITGYPSSDFIDNKVRTFESTIYRDDSTICGKIISDAIERKEPYESEYRVVHADGTIRWVYDKGRVVFGNNNELLYLDGAIFDITERKRAQEKLGISDLRLNMVSKASGAVVWDWNLITDELDWNEEYYKVFGYSEIDTLPTIESWSDFVHKDDVENTLDGLYKAINSGETNWTAEYRFRKKDGSYAFTLDWGTVIHDEKGKPVRMIGAMLDITERKRAEDERKNLQEQLTQTQKMESIGTLAGGIAHDFNNILGGIIGYTELAQDDAVPGSSVQNYLVEVLKSATRAKDLVKQILTFSRKSQEERKPILLYPIVKEAEKLLRSAIPTTIEIRQSIDETTGTVNADPTQMHQIVMNLCTNAAHAMHETGGVLEIALSSVLITKESMSNYHDLSPGPFLVLKISDTGSGIDPKIIHRIYEPFFTTKDKEKGTGMGLAVVHGIVKDHGGDIDIDSQLGKGTTFTILLPRVITEPDKEEGTQFKTPTGNEHILFVDDEKTLLDVGEKMLLSLGYTVTSCDNSLEALEIFQQTPDKFDMVITDQTMPHMTGYSLAKRILEIKPTISVILCTGYSDTVTPEKVEAAGIKALVYKPISRKDIARTIREALDKKDF